MNNIMSLQERAQRHIERMDIVVKAAEIKYGLLAGITAEPVPPELAAKFDAQWQKLSEAIMDSRHEDVIVLADGVVRGIWALDRFVVLAGADPLALSPIGLETHVMASNEVVGEYVASGLPLDQELGF